MGGKKKIRKPKKASKALKNPKRTSKPSKTTKKVPKPSKQSKPAKKPHDSVSSTVEKIRNLEVQGANDIAEAGVSALKKVAEGSDASSRKAFLEEINRAAEQLKSARPTEPALRNAIDSIISSAEHYELKSIDNVRKYAVRKADTFLKDLKQVVETIADIGSEEIRNDDVIVTHCHSEHVVEILKKAKEKRRKFKVIVTETRPMNQGLITARELAEAKIEVEYIVDSAVATVMKRATKMIVGCDAILADGSIVNKIGTYMMALLAKQFQTPVFIAAETIKFDPLTVMGAAEPIEERDPREIIDPRELRKVKIRNPAFDVTPADLIDAMITEKGVMKPELVRENVKSPV